MGKTDNNVISRPRCMNTDVQHSLQLALAVVHTCTKITN